jgi:hypothetical protein
MNISGGSASQITDMRSLAADIPGGGDMKSLSCSISDAVVYVDGEQELQEQGIEGNEFTAPVNARPAAHFRRDRGRLGDRSETKHNSTHDPGIAIQT